MLCRLLPSAHPAPGTPPAPCPLASPCPSSAWPGHPAPNQGPSRRGGWLRPPLSVTPHQLCPGPPQHRPVHGAVLGLWRGPCARAMSPGCPRVPPAPLPSPQPRSCIPGLQNFAETLRMPLLGSRPCQELQLQSREGGRLQTRSPPRSPSPGLGNPHQSVVGAEDTSGTPAAGQAGGEAGRAAGSFPKPPPVLTDGSVPCGSGFPGSIPEPPSPGMDGGSQGPGR